MSSSQVAAREEIRDLVARYNDHGDAGRVEALLDLFLDDAQLEIRDGPTYRGREEMKTLFSSVTPGDSKEQSAPVRIWHHTSTLVIDLEDDSQAQGRCYFAVLTPGGLDHWGRYKDRYAYHEGRWRFSERHVTVDGRIPGGWADNQLSRLPNA